MKCTKALVKNLQTLALQDFFKKRDPLSSSRKEYKFLIPMETLPEIIKFLKKDFLAITDKSNYIHKYLTFYYDTPDYKFFHLHRQGKYNRIKIRIREYQTLMCNSFIECKRKIKGKKTKKYRVKITNQDKDVLNQNFIKKNLARHNLTKDNLKNTLQIGYSRIFLLAKDFSKRLSLDFNLKARNEKNEKINIMPKHVILEIKAKTVPKKIITYLKREHKIRQSGFSKYCIGLCLLNKELKSNKWKQVLKYHYA
ncbi:VTC domain-containing protein [Candidatus Peregrinibacteria bacterium]|nr:VTC domain-containing protein [Candidatus Peregrinibacteria bacterium]